MPFENLMADITRQHGTTVYKPSQGGAAVKVRGSLGSRRHYSFTIFNFAAYGSRNTPAPQVHADSFSSLTIQEPGDPNRVQVRMNIGDTGYLCRERSIIPNVFSIKDTRGRTVIQVCDRALFLLFDIEQCRDAEITLRAIYENYVLPLNVRNAINGEMTIVALRRPAPRPTQATATVGTERWRAAENPPERPRVTPIDPTIPPQEVGRGTNWDILRGTRVPRIADTSDAEGAVKYLKTARVRGLSERMKEAEQELNKKKQEYQKYLRSLNEATVAMNSAEDNYMGLVAVQQQRESQQDDADILALTEVLNARYEKVWTEPGNFLFGLTKPIVMEYRHDERDEVHDNFKALAGQFVVRVSGEDVQYYRADARVAMTDAFSTKKIAPHCMVNSSGGNMSICWGTYRTLVDNCLRSGDMAQVLLLVAQHLTSVTKADCYMQLREYAVKLDLPRTEDVNVDLLEEYRRVEEQRRAAETASQFPQRRQPDNRIVDAGPTELSDEDLRRLNTLSTRTEEATTARSRLPQRNAEPGPARLDQDPPRAAWRRAAIRTHSVILDGRTVADADLREGEQLALTDLRNPRLEDAGVEMFHDAEGNENEAPWENNPTHPNFVDPVVNPEVFRGMVEVEVHEDHMDAELEDDPQNDTEG